MAVGDILEIRKGPYTFIITIKGLSNRRGPAKEAILLYEESQESIEKRERLRIGMQAQIRPDPGGRPTKKDRRNLAKIRQAE